MALVTIALGANLGEPLATLRKVVSDQGLARILGHSGERLL